MNGHSAWTIRPAQLSDREAVLDLIRSAEYLHQHLDWVDALSLLGETPYVIAFREKRIVGCLACPPDPPNVSWIRLFATSLPIKASELWEPLWHQAAQLAASIGVNQVAALLSVDWFAPLLKNSGFKHSNDVVFLEWCRQPLPPSPVERGKIRPMRDEDLDSIADLDQRAFGLIWQYSIKTLHHAFRQAALASVIEIEDRIAAYQISTVAHYGAHLARLAVEPDWQRQGLGRSLVIDTLYQLSDARDWKMSVNTQLDNTRSLRLYQELGFKRTGPKHPVYDLALPT